jgi:Flp pilus assembly protein TadD
MTAAKIHFLRLILFALVGAGLSAAEPGVTVPPEVAAALNEAQDSSNPAKALERLRAYQGKPHALISLLTGQMAYRLAREDSEQQAAHRATAEKAYRQALEIESGLRQAALGLAQLAADADEWQQAVTWCARAIDVNAANAQELLFYAQAAQRADDVRLLTTLIGQGVMRFPDETGFRRLEVAMLVRSQRAEEAGNAVRALLTKAPEETDLWRNLSWAEHASGKDLDALAALEAAALSKPTDRELARRLGESQLAQDMPQAALETFRGLIEEPPSQENLTDSRLIEIAARAAAAAGDVVQGRAWLAHVPAPNRNRGQRLLAARLAVQSGDVPAADAAMRELIDLGENDPGALTWAGHLAERLKDDARAEALYQQAAANDSREGGTATLRLVVLMHRQNRLEEAEVLLASHLAKHPDDQQAIALRANLALRKQEAKR